MAFIPFIIVMLAVQLLTTDSNRGLARKAYKQEMNGVLDESEVNYLRALEYNTSLYQAQFNLGNNMYYQERYGEALSFYNRLISRLDAPKDIKAKALHNLGLTYLQLDKLDESRSALIQSLKLLPNDSIALYNLSYVIQKIDKLNKQSTNHDGVDKQELSENAPIDKSRSNRPNNDDDSSSPSTINEEQNIEQALTAQDLHEQSIKERIKAKISPGTKPIPLKYW